MSKFLLKGLGVVAAVALLVGVAVPAANALTASELLDLLIALDIVPADKVDAAKAALGTPAAAGGSCALASAPDMTIGATGANVIALQDMLIAGGYLTIPAGVSKGYFGSLTQAALASYQAANGIAPAAGYFGPITRASITCDAGDDDMGGDTGGSGSTGLSGGAGDVSVTDRSSGVKDEVLEGEEEVKVLGMEIEADGSDIEITSVKVSLQHTGSGNTRLNRYVDEVLIMHGDDVVGSSEADDFSESSDVYTESISVSGVVIDEDDEERLYVAISAVNNIDSSDLSENWSVDVTQTRFVDATGAILTDTTNVTAQTFTFEDLSTTGDVELKVNEDDEDINGAHTVQVDATSDTNNVELLSFTLEAEGSDIEMQQLIFDITSSGAGVTEIVNDFRLLMDGEEVGTVSYDLNQDNTGGDSTASSTDTAIAILLTDLDDDDVNLDEDDVINFVLEGDINDIDGAFSNGDYITVTLSGNSTDVNGDDENGDQVTDVTGSADSTQTKFASTGIMTEVIDSSATKVTNTADDSTDDQGEFVLDIEVTAFEDIAYIALTGSATSTDTDPANAGVYAYVEGTNNTEITTGTTTVTVERVSGGTRTGNYIKINSGQSAIIRVTVLEDAATTATQRAQVQAVNFAATAVAGTSQHLTVPAEDYESPSTQILN
jgi:hypothetical protein